MRTVRPEPAERGGLDIHSTVLCKIVEYAADSVPGTLRHERRLAGLEVGESGASARVTGRPGRARARRCAAGADAALPGRESAA